MCRESQAMGKDSKMGVPPACLVIMSNSANLSFFILWATIHFNEQWAFDLKQFPQPNFPQPNFPLAFVKEKKWLQCWSYLLARAPAQLLPGPLLHLVDFQVRKDLKRDHWCEGCTFADKSGLRSVSLWTIPCSTSICPCSRWVSSFIYFHLSQHVAVSQQNPMHSFSLSSICIIQHYMIRRLKSAQKSIFYS